METIKDYLPTALIFALVIAFAVLLFAISSNDKTKQDRAVQAWIESCLERPGRKVETVGGVFASQFLVCNPN